MGQYYMAVVKPINEENSKFKGYDTWQIHNGSKLTEHSYYFNNFVEKICSLLENKPSIVIWCGDYADIDDINEDRNNLTEEILKECQKQWGRKKNYKLPKTDKVFINYFLINHTKKCYIDLNNCYIENVEKDKKSWKYGFCFHPLPLLTAVGNGKGGGDYRGVNEEDIGCWAGDVLEISHNVSKDYIDITFDIEFREED